MRDWPKAIAEPVRLCAVCARRGCAAATAAGATGWRQAGRQLFGLGSDVKVGGRLLQAARQQGKCPPARPPNGILQILWGRPLKREHHPHEAASPPRQVEASQRDAASADSPAGVLGAGGRAERTATARRARTSWWSVGNGVDAASSRRGRELARPTAGLVTILPLLAPDAFCVCRTPDARSTTPRSGLSTAAEPPTGGPSERAIGLRRDHPCAGGMCPEHRDKGCVCLAYDVLGAQPHPSQLLAVPQHNTALTQSQRRHCLVP